MKRKQIAESLGFFFDTETTGIPDWKIPSEDPSQPHITQLAAVVVDMQTMEIHGSLNLYVKTDGWEIPEDCIDLNGINANYLEMVGMPEKEALLAFLHLWNSHKRYAYNTTFDNRIIRIAIKRYLNEDTAELWKDAPYQCAMIEAKNNLKLKSVKLKDAYQQICGKELIDGHDAMADTLATVELWFKMFPPSTGMEGF